MPPSRRWLTCIVRHVVLVAVLFLAAPGSAQRVGAPRESERQQAIAFSEVISHAVGAPARIQLLNQATMRLTDNLSYVDRGLASRYLRAFQRPDSDDLVGLFLQGGNLEWLATVRFIDGGFLDPIGIRTWSNEDILGSLRQALAAEDTQRVGQGLTRRTVKGWLVPPRYDAETHTLEWAASTPPENATRDRETEATHNIAFFGRDGYFLLEIFDNAGNVRDGQDKSGLFLNNLGFVEGKRAADFVAVSDKRSASGVESVLGVPQLKRVGWFDSLLSADNLFVVMVGAGLVIGATLLGVVQFAAYRRRLRHRI